jgi:FlaA1/EpsC-like NDP-sugar epimerase
MKSVKNLLILLADAAAIAFSFLLSFLLRFDFHLPASMGELFRESLAVVLIVKLAVFLSFRFYRNLWRYTSLRDAIDIVRVVITASLVSALVLALTGVLPALPRSILVIDCFLLLFMVSASRLAWRFYRELSMAHAGGGGSRTLIFGAGAAGSQLLHEIRRQADSPYNVAGFIDDDAAKQGKYLNGVPVLGTRDQLPALVRKQGIKQIIFAIPSARGSELRNIIESCTALDVRFSTLPTLADIIDGRVSVFQIRNVEISDLLGRDPVVLDEEVISVFLTGKKVLISGAAGSIGSEICRQVARFGPGRLVLLDNAETPLFYLEREMKEKYSDLQIVPIIGDVRNQEKMELIFENFRPDVVFHAAAYKHVPMMEFNPTEAVANNIGGTKIMADAAHRFGVRNFVLISSDKAVNPTNVMGASKRAAEMYVQALAPSSVTKFTTVRFGNVLGSNGSVIPLFMEQIRKGGPVTVTDANVTRYFMTIPEATQLVLQAACFGKEGRYSYSTWASRCAS